MGQAEIIQQAITRIQPHEGQNHIRQGRQAGVNQITRLPGRAELCFVAVEAPKAVKTIEMIGQSSHRLFKPG